MRHLTAFVLAAIIVVISASGPRPGSGPGPGHARRPSHLLNQQPAVPTSNVNSIGRPPTPGNGQSSSKTPASGYGRRTSSRSKAKSHKKSSTVTDRSIFNSNGELWHPSDFQQTNTPNTYPQQPGGYYTPVPTQQPFDASQTWHSTSGTGSNWSATGYNPSSTQGFPPTQAQAPTNFGATSFLQNLNEWWTVDSNSERMLSKAPQAMQISYNDQYRTLGVSGSEMPEFNFEPVPLNDQSAARVRVSYDGISSSLTIDFFDDYGRQQYSWILSIPSPNEEWPLKLDCISHVMGSRNLPQKRYQKVSGSGQNTVYQPTPAGLGQPTYGGYDYGQNQFGASQPTNPPYGNPQYQQPYYPQQQPYQADDQSGHWTGYYGQPAPGPPWH